MKLLTIESNDAGQRLDKFLRKAVKTLPPALLYKSIRLKKIKVNRRRAEPSQILQAGDSVQLFLDERFFSDSQGEQSFLHLTPRVSPLYEDENILLFDKRPGMLVHADDEQVTDTLIDHIKAYLYRKGEYLPDREQSFAPALCNRIDRNTGGIVIAAKNARALREMNEKIKAREVKKTYLLAAHGSFAKKSGTLQNWLKKDSARNTVELFSARPRGAEGEDAKEAVTFYRVLEEAGELSLVEAELLTGRTHQIRAQFAGIGHPLLGDGKYGVNREDKQRGYKFQALYAYRVTFAFQGDAGCLENLRGKSFFAPRENIWFLKEFPQAEKNLFPGGV